MLSSDKIGFARTSGLGRVALVGLGEPVVSHTEKVILAATVFKYQENNKCSSSLSKVFSVFEVVS